MRDLTRLSPADAAMRRAVMEYRADLRKLLAKRQGGLCFYCRRPMNTGHPNMGASLDEKVPRWMGGETNDLNSVAACYGCNQRKGPMPAQIFIVVRLSDSFDAVRAEWDMKQEWARRQAAEVLPLIARKKRKPHSHRHKVHDRLKYVAARAPSGADEPSGDEA